MAPHALPHVFEHAIVGLGLGLLEIAILGLGIIAWASIVSVLVTLAVVAIQARGVASQPVNDDKRKPGSETPKTRPRHA